MLLLALLSSVFCAHAQWAVDINIGTAINRNTAYEANREFFDSASQAHAIGDDKRGAFEIGASVPTDERFYTHVSYINFGRIHPAIIGREDAVSEYVNNITDIPLHELQGLTLSLRRYLPLGEIINLRLSAGLFHWNARYQLKNDLKPLYRKDSGLSHTIGLGLNVIVTDNYSVQLGWDAYSTPKNTVDVMSLGLQWFIGGRPKTKREN